MDSRRSEPSEQEMARTANARSGLYRPSCIILLLPALSLLALIFLGVLGGWTLWIALPIITLVLIIAAFRWWANRKRAA